MSMTELSKNIRFFNGEKGFESPALDIHKKLLLAVSEICEAQEELRDGNEAVKIYYEGMQELPYTAEASLDSFPENVKPLGFSVEIADAIIRLLDICAAFNIDIQAVVELKLAYNRTRPEKHGRQF